MKEGNEEHRSLTGLGHRLLPPFATKGRGENLLKVNARERGRKEEKEDRKTRGLREISTNPFLFLVSTSCLG